MSSSSENNNFTKSNSDNHQSGAAAYEDSSSHFNAIVSPSPDTRSRFFRNEKTATPQAINSNLPPPPPKTPFMCFSESRDQKVRRLLGNSDVEV